MSLEAKLIPNYIYLYHLDKFVIIPTWPESINDSLGSRFAETNALARTAPVFSYNHSGPRHVNISIKLHRDLLDDVNLGVSNLKDNVVDFHGDDYMDTLIRYLQSAALPRYNIFESGSKTVIPPMVAVRFGDSFFIKGVVNGGVTVVWEKPILYNNKYAVGTITFDIYETDPYSADDIIAEGSLRGITATFRNGIYRDTEENTITNPATLTGGAGGVSYTKPVSGSGTQGTAANTGNTNKPTGTPSIHTTNYAKDLAEAKKYSSGVILPSQSKPVTSSTTTIIPSNVLDHDWFITPVDHDHDNPYESNKPAVPNNGGYADIWM